MKRLFSLTLLLCLASSAFAAVQGRAVSYRAGDTTLKGWLSYDTALTGRHPAVLVVHEWWGHNAYARQRAEQLAALGYVALALDMYGDGKQASHPDEAGKFAAEVAQNRALMRSRFNAAVEFLRQQNNVDGSKLAAIGYCFGGSVVLNMAREGADLKGVASFHGGLVTDTPAQPGKVRAKVRVFTGADDRMIPPAQVDAFKQEMSAAGVDYQLVSYPGVLHSFTNPDADELARRFKLPLAYDAAADRDSWAQLQTFLQQLFK